MWTQRDLLMGRDNLGRVMPGRALGPTNTVLEAVGAGRVTVFDATSWRLLGEVAFSGDTDYFVAVDPAPELSRGSREVVYDAAVISGCVGNGGPETVRTYYIQGSE